MFVNFASLIWIMIVCTEQYYKYFCKPENPKIKIFSTFSVLNNFVEAISLLTLSGLCLPSGLAIAIFYSAHILLITPHTLYTHSLTPSSWPLTHFTHTHSHHPPRPSHTLQTLTHILPLHTLYTHSLTHQLATRQSLSLLVLFPLQCLILSRSGLTPPLERPPQ